eukprot:gene10429-2560_t
MENEESHVETTPLLTSNSCVNSRGQDRLAISVENVFPIEKHDSVLESDAYMPRRDASKVSSISSTEADRLKGVCTVAVKNEDLHHQPNSSMCNISTNRSSLGHRVNEDSIILSLERLEHELVHLRSICTQSKGKFEHEKLKTRNIRHRRRWLSPKITHRLLLLTIIWQILNVGILTLLDRRIPQKKLKDHIVEDPAMLAGVIIMVVFQTIQMIVIVIASVKLAKQILHQTASNSFLIQSYLSTVILYAGVYTLLYRVDSDSFRGLESSLSSLTSKGFIFLCFVKFLYFSVTTMTSTGFGDVSPGSWYMDLIVSTQMLISIIYTTSIFAKGLTVIA